MISSPNSSDRLARAGNGHAKSFARSALRASGQDSSPARNIASVTKKKTIKFSKCPYQMVSTTSFRFTKVIMTPMIAVIPFNQATRKRA